MKFPMVSIIIPTYNSKDYLKAALMSIESLEYPKDKIEVVVADDGSTDGTEDMVDEIKEKLSFSLKYYRQENKGPGEARNLGISKSKGEFLAFTDSDCTVHKNWLKSFVKYFENDNVGIVGGPALAQVSDNFFLKCASYSNNSFIGTGGMRRGKGLRLSRYYPRSFNMIVSKKAIDTIGNFKLSEIYGEDTELSYRITKAGFSVQYAPEAIVWHSEKTDLPSFIKQVFKKGRARIRIARMHKVSLEPLHLLPAIMIISFLFLTFLSVIFDPPIKILIALISIYLIILSIAGFHASMKIKDVRALVAVPFLLLIQHFSYGLGFILELITIGR